MKKVFNFFFLFYFILIHQREKKKHEKGCDGGYILFLLPFFSPSLFISLIDKSSRCNSYSKRG